MRIPEKPPRPSDLLKPDNLGNFFSTIFPRPDVVSMVRRANDEYLHWDKLRYKRLPEGVSLEQMWTAILLSRLGHFRELPLRLVDGSALKVWIPSQHLEWLHTLDQQGGGKMSVLTRRHIAENDGSFLRNALMEEAIASSLLEGAATTREVAKKMLRENRKPRDEAERMILNNYKAILMIRDLKNERMTPRVLLDIHKVLAQGTLKNEDALGRFRLDGELVQVEDNRTDEVIFTPPPAGSIPSRLEELCAFANEKTKPFIHPILKAISLHFMLGYIHPFVDGNGRTARAVFYWYMLKRGYWAFEYLPISRIFLKAPIKYARAYLYTETDNSDLTYFIHYNLKGLVRAVDDLHEYLERQERDISQAATWLESYPGLNHRQLLVVVDALKHRNRSYSIKQHQTTHRVGYATARADLLGLEEAGLFEKRQIGHKLFFSPDQNLRHLLRIGALGLAQDAKVPPNPIRTKQSSLPLE